MTDDGADTTGPGYPLPLQCRICSRALANLGEWCCGRFVTEADVVPSGPLIEPRWVGPGWMVCCEAHGTFGPVFGDYFTAALGVIGHAAHHHNTGTAGR